jgi:purine-binding chemotaxis protein CheW
MRMSDLARKFCTFYVDGQFFGVDVERVQEIIRFQEMTRVPLSSRTVGGLLSLRGQIVIAIDLRERLEAPSRPENLQPTNVLVRSDSGLESLLVDEIGEVVEVDLSAFESPPCTLKGVSRELVKAVCKMDGKLLLLLDVNQVVQWDRQGKHGLRSEEDRKE